MNLGQLSKVEDAKGHLDIAFGRGRRRADEQRPKTSVKRGIIEKSRRIEKERIVAVSKSLQDTLGRIIKNFPSFDQLPSFYRELANTTMDVDGVKQALGAVQWAVDNVERLTKQALWDVSGYDDISKMNARRRAFYGRVSSLVKQIDKKLSVIEKARRTFKNYPPVKTSMHTIIIAGMPNVGKTSLLTAITGATPKIASYPFTTQNLMLGYTGEYQFIDTPGLLDRSAKNDIEKRASIALKHLPSLILFLIDPTESCGFSVDEQISLKKNIEKNFDVPLLTIVTKKDIAEPEDIERLIEKVQIDIVINANDAGDSKKVLDIIKKKVPVMGEDV